jgi:Fur family ferric uptake transcriptional regulator
MTKTPEIPNHKLRMTRQRTIILEELGKARTHPAADEIYSRVRQRLPRISLGTVYRNLDVLAKAGLIAKLEIAGGPRRYDVCIEDHCHIKCVNCGRIEDIFVSPGTGFEEGPSKRTGYRITGHHVEFTGVCPKCENRVSPPNSGKGG